MTAIISQNSEETYDKTSSEGEELISENDSIHSNDEENADTDAGNTGWANSMARVLSENKPKNKSILVLSKAKKETDVKSKKKIDPGFQIDGEIKEEKDEKPDKNDLITEALRLKHERIARKRKRESFLGLRYFPEVTERERERALKKIATKGVVQLFNAVRAQQKDLTEKVASERLDHKREEILNNIDKKKFLDVLMGGTRAKSEFIDNPVKKEEPEDVKPSTWNVLRDDFMIPRSKSNKDWDKMDEDDDDNASKQSEEEKDDNDESD